MKAVVYHGRGDVRLDEVGDPELRDPTDAIIRVTTNAICGTDLHLVRGTMAGMKPGTILGHEGVGIVESMGREVRSLDEGDRVVVCATIGCGTCVYCRDGYYSQCDRANPNGRRAGTVFFGGPEETGSVPGLLAERARIPYAGIGCVKVPEDVTDDQALLLADVFPTGYFGAEMANIKPGHVVVVFGCGPVGQFAITSARTMGAGRILAIDSVESRLMIARAQGAEAINFEKDDPIEVILALTDGIGADCAIDAVGVDANRPHHGAGAKAAEAEEEEFEKEREQVAPGIHPEGESWRPGDAPSQALRWAIEGLAKAGTLSIIGVYPPAYEAFPMGKAMAKNLVVRSGNCNHRRYLPKLMDLVRSGVIEPSAMLTQIGPFASAIECFEAFDKREPDWVKVELLPSLQ